MFERPMARQRHYELKLGSVLDKKGLHAVFTFDEPVIREPVRRGLCGSEQTKCVPGLIGNARAFSGSDSSMIWTGVRWRELAETYSISMWVKIRRGASSQAIMWWTGGSQKTGLMLVRGRMTFAVPGRAASVAFSYPFEDYDRYVLITAVVDRQAGFARLYQDGALKAEGAVSVIEHPGRHVVFGRMNSFKIGFPFNGDLDETAFWSRALSDEEILELYRSRKSLLAELGGRYLVKYKASAAVSRFLRALPGYLELFNPFLHSGHLEGMNLPVCDLILSGDDQRWLNSQHGWHLKNRTVPEDGRRSRKVKLALAGKTVEARLSLIYPSAMTSTCHRMSYAVELEPGVVWHGMNKFALLAPEDHGMLMPLAENAMIRKFGLPAARDKITVLRVNGSVRGAFYCADYQDYAFESHHRKISMPNLIKYVPVDEAEITGVYDALAGQNGRALINDTLSGVSARESRCRLACDREEVRAWISEQPVASGETAGAVADMLHHNVIRGDNVSLMCITTNLPLNEIRIPGMCLQWISSRPDIIDEYGRVRRPSGGDPAGVELRLEIQGPEGHATRVYQAAVQPENYQIPIADIHTPEFPNNIYRIPCVAQISGDHLSMPMRCGTIKMRGNSAVFYPKKSFSIAMDCPHGVFGETKSRHLYFVGCGKDSSQIRNKLSYELFRDMSVSGFSRHVPQVKMVELVLNGEYLGVYQLMQRVDRHMLGWPDFKEEDERHSVLYKADGAAAGFREAHQDQYQQKEPDEALYPYWAPYHELIRFIGTSSPKEFGTHIGERMDIPNIVDFHLFLLLTNNRDGNNHNLYLAREGGAGRRFFIIPWDYDTAFMAGGLLSNGLFERLEADFPEYPGLLKQRWSELRQSVYSEQAIFDRIDAMHAEVAPAFAREKIGGVRGSDRRAAAMHELKAWISARLSEVDRHLATLP